MLVILSLCPAHLLADNVDFDRDVAPILEERCWHCHGEEESESGLRLDLRAALLRGGDSGLSVVVPGKPEQSYLVEVINHVDADRPMPPDDEKLPAAEIDILTRWIKAGAIWPGQMQDVARVKSAHWSLQPIVRPDIPDVATASSNPIDRFLQHRLQRNRLSFSAPADPRGLIRRLSIVLTGLPPTALEAAEFLTAFAKDSETSYANAVDRLLQSPHFGERWAQHWLDVIRWAETNGSESNMYRKNAWIYRDYVVRAFNEDKPYDQFLLEQFAGDTVHQGDATGYLVSGPHVPSATVGKEPAARRQARADRMDEILQTVGASVLGVTIGCARCHNHKFDPISINDYYRLSAVFQDIEFGSRIPELPEDHPEQIMGRRLCDELRQLRGKLVEVGPWEEDWIGHKEVHFPAIRTQSMRITFMANHVRIDELEIFGDGGQDKNLALKSVGTATECSEEITDKAFPVTRINDGLYGNDSWLVRGNKERPMRPWVLFTFQQPQKVSSISLSTNREDFLVTDYVQGLNKHSFEPLLIEVQAGDGQWIEIAATKQIQRSSIRHSERAALLEELRLLIQQCHASGPQSSFVARFVRPAITYVFGRGSPENPRGEVFAGGLSELGSELGLRADANGPQRRKAFAEWMISADNPLTARVASNRLWHHVFGRGIVVTTSDFGAAGAPPSHPKLLDWLAAELTHPGVSEPSAQPWSMQHLIRLMVMSEAFRQSSRPREKGLARDADSALMWRFPPKRVEAEVIRDSMLQASGLLDRTIGGRSYRIHNVKKRYAQWEVTNNHGPDTWRRMLYQERMRRVDDQMFTAFDFPDCGQVRAKRPVSTTPLQALNLMNSEFVIEQSRQIARRAADDVKGDGRQSIDRCFELLLGRFPSELERDACLALVKDGQLSLVCRALVNSNEFAFLP